MTDIFLGEEILGYRVEEYKGGGAIGKIYRAYNPSLEDSRAIKFIPVGEETLRDGWENEIIKVNKLKYQDNVVKYHTHKTVEIKSEKYLYIMWDYIENDSLSDLIKNQKLTINILIDVIECCLRVMHACSVVGIVHADLHGGNILIQKESNLNIDTTYRKIWITDFGYLTQYSKKDYLDDYDGLNRIIQESLRSISYNFLNGEKKKIYSYLKNEFSRYLIEKNPVMGVYVRNAKELLKIFQLKINNINEAKKITSTGVGDFLAAEHLGDYFEEWKALFVPKFIGIEEIISRNISVLTGLRGCGKTMLFKRLSSYFNCKLGSSNIPGSDSFYGFYLNARNIPEAFPWLPNDKEDIAREQVINHFNLSWCLEILQWIREINKNNKYDLTFLNRFFKRFYPEYFSSGSNSQSIYYLSEMIETKISSSRLQSCYKKSSWPLAHYDFLETFVKEIKENILETEKMPFYFFLDDYSLPMVKESMQLILNPIIFRRSANVIFKVSTESVESFIPIGLNRKALEENSDYTLVDCGGMTLTKNHSYIKDILSSILKPRIERHPTLKGRNLDLDSLLGKTHFDNEGLAKIIKEGKGANLYQGATIFCDIWSSDVREMINILAEMISKEDEEHLSKNDFPIISDRVQNDVYMEIGGQFMGLLAAATNPELNNYDVDRKHTYADHLVAIVKAFQEIASHEMKTKTSKNQDKAPIKKARKIEITNVDKELPDSVRAFYKGLIRYGIFIRDYRGKSVRGKVVPRLVLRGLLIPYFKITFSKRDNISMSWDDFIKFLLDPVDFSKRWKGNEIPQIPVNLNYPRGRQSNLFSEGDL